ncbi:MAG: hypothetical protein MK207_09220 [Saprospiraceae bacterium]|nr:hypothetical protein [Saprospiraceae bacterium]
MSNLHHSILFNTLFLSIKILTIFVIILVFSCSCIKEEAFDITELNDLYFNYDRGLLFGLDLNDNWEAAKRFPNQAFTLNECSSPWYIKKWNPSELLGINITLDKENRIERLSSKLYVLKKNQEALIKWSSTLKEHLIKKIGPFDDTKLKWDFIKNGKKASTFFKLEEAKSLINGDSLFKLEIYISIRNY